MAALKDINKDSILKMLHIDVFGFSASKIEEKAKEVYNMVSGGGQKSSGSVHGSDVILAGGYVRNSSGFIILTSTEAVSGKKGKKK